MRLATAGWWPWGLLVNPRTVAVGVSLLADIGEISVHGNAAPKHHGNPGRHVPAQIVVLDNVVAWWEVEIVLPARWHLLTGDHCRRYDSLPGRRVANAPAESQHCPANILRPSAQPTTRLDAANG